MLYGFKAIFLTYRILQFLYSIFFKFDSPATFYAEQMVVMFMAKDMFVVDPIPAAPSLPEYGQVQTAIGDPPVFGATILRS